MPGRTFEFAGDEFHSPPKAHNIKVSPIPNQINKAGGGVEQSGCHISVKLPLIENLAFITTSLPLGLE